MFYRFNRHINSTAKILLCAMVFLLCVGKTYSQDLDYRAQSLYIYKFTKYIYWPTEKQDRDFRIGVFGKSPIFKELQLMASLKKAGNGQTIIVDEISLDDSLSVYDIIYISSSKSRQISLITDQVKNQAILLVAERERMANKGASINFMVTDTDILKFEFNLARLKEQQLKISDELIKLGYEI